MLLFLGKVDPGSMPTDRKNYLKPFHGSMTNRESSIKFKDEVKGTWKSFSTLTGSAKPILELQTFLKDAGFMPNTNLDGVFGYRTFTGVRLFQEYVRTIEGESIVPDGIVGDGTRKHIKRWKDKGLVCEWNKGEPSTDFTQWINFLSKAKQYYEGEENRPAAEKNNILPFSEKFTRSTATRKIADWDTSPDSVHLIGIRRGQGQNFQVRNTNQDLFALLIKGMVFYFWGSTVPRRHRNTVKDGVMKKTIKQKERDTGYPFLLEGQHQYHFGWHMQGNATKTYKALRSSGVLVFRTNEPTSSRSIDNLADLSILFNENNNNRNNRNPNSTINIHSSGIGRSNYSAGCQVIAGASYINNRGEVVDCTKGKTSKELIAKPHGAYGLFADLIVNYASPTVQSVSYTLAREDTDFLADTTEKALFDKIKGLEQKMHDALG